ncbi:MobV family relaxase, partial [Clostridioides difficile]|uniref:MobV family relaxase n=1 Tax=Clostridioides difficile TaxID=1496 RepID=UPI001596B86D
MGLSEDNYDLIPCDNDKRSIKGKLANLVESRRAVRKDAVVVCDFIVTSDNEAMDTLGADRQREYFQDSVKWFYDRYGADRVLNATVHMDETTPHLHIGVMPIPQDGRLSAKAIFTKDEMKAIQTEIDRDVGEKYGLARGVEGYERTHLAEA